MNKLRIKMNFKFLFGAALIFIVSCAGSQKVQNKYDSLSFPELRSYETPETTTFTTENGIRFYLMENKELPLISVNATVRGGDIQSSNDKVGLASILGTVMRSGGSEKYPADELNELLESKAASIETYMGFSSGGASMSILKEDFDELLPVLLDVMMNPLLPEDKIDLDKKQSKSAITRRNEDAQGITNREFDRLIYGPNSVYGRNTEIATVEAVTRDDLIRYHEKVFVGSNMYIGVIGDFDTEEMKAKLEKAFSSIPSGSENKIEYPEVEYEFKNSINFANKEDVNQSVIYMGHIGGKRNDDYPALQLMNEILSGGFSGRLMQTVRTDMGLAYGVFGAYQQGINYDGQFYTGVMTKSETTAEAIKAIKGQIELLQNEKVTEQELNDAKDRILNSVVFRNDSRGKILSRRINNEFNGLPADYFEKYVEGIKNTSIDDIQKVAVEYLKPEKLEIMVVGNKEQIGDQLAEFGEVNEVDITIPIPGMDKNKVEGDSEKAKMVLNAMAKALTSDQDLSGYQSSVEATQFNERIPGGKMTIAQESDVEYDGKIVSELNTPNGTITMEVDGNKGSMSMGPNSRPLPPQQIAAIKKEMMRSPHYIASNRAKLDAVHTGEETLSGKTYDVVVINSEPQVTILVEKDSNLPMYVRYSDVNPMTGEAQNITVAYSDWKDANGYKFAGKSVTTALDKVVSESIIKSWKAN